MQVFRTKDCIELDRCFFCGGLWFDRGELEAVVGRSIEFAPTDAATTRLCARCARPLSTASLRGVQVETCHACASAYLDDGELERLAGGKVPLERVAPEGRADPEPTFRCCGCGEEKPLAEGLTSVRGMACALCYPSMDATPSLLPDHAGGSLGGPLAGQAGAPVLPGGDLTGMYFVRIIGALLSLCR